MKGKDGHHSTRPAVDDRPYRPCVGIMLLNAENHVFVGNRIDTPGDHWQMPQGGIDDGEDPQDAAFRELQEEIGTDKAHILFESDGWHAYDVPYAISLRMWGGRYRGQTQKWFAMRFEGSDRDIDLDYHDPEFSEWRWTPLDRLVASIVPFKRDIYERIVAEFAPKIETLGD